MILAARFLRVVVGAAFVAAGAGKLLDRDAPRVGPVLLGATSGPVAFSASLVEDALPWLELLAGIAVWSGTGRIVRHALGFGLASVFLAVAVAIPDGTRCGCFGTFGDFETRSAHVAVALALAAAVVVAFSIDRKLLRHRHLGLARRIPVLDPT